MPVARIFMTPLGLQKLQQQKESLARRLSLASGALTDSMAERNEDAASVALADKMKLQAQMREVDGLLGRSAPLKKQHSQAGVELGSTVDLQTDKGERSFTLVDTQEVNPLESLISPESPLGRALMGHRRGDKITVDLPIGRMHFTIRRVR